MLLNLVRERQPTTVVLLLLLALLQMIIDYSPSQKDSESAPLNSQLKPEKELLLPRVNASLLTNLLKLPPLERMSFSSEVPEIEKPKDSSAFTQVKRDLTLPPESEPKEENGKEPEEEDENDDSHYLKLIHRFNISIALKSSISL